MFDVINEGYDVVTEIGDNHGKVYKPMLREDGLYIPTTRITHGGSVEVCYLLIEDWLLNELSHKFN